MPGAESSSLLDSAAAQLYGLPPGQFTARRDQLAGEARSAGEPAQGKAIKALRRPTAAAWLVNALVRADGEEIREVLALGEQARGAAGGDSADFPRRRRAAVQAALRRARQIAREAGESSADAVLRDVESTIEAAIADAGAASAVRTGRLRRPLQSGGFDAVDLEGAVAGAAPSEVAGRPKLTVIAGGRAERSTSSPRTASPRTASPRTPPAARTAPAARTRARDLSREEAAAEAALAQLDQTSRSAQQAHDAADSAQQEIEQLRAHRAELERELSATQQAQSAAAQRAARARRLAAEADRRLNAAQRRAVQAQQRLDAARAAQPSDS